MENNSYNSNVVISEQGKTDGLCLAGFIVSLVSLILCGCSVSLVSLILSIVGVTRIKKNGHSGKGLGIAGIVISAVSIVIFIIYVIIFFFYIVVIGGAAVLSESGNYSSHISRQYTTSNVFAAYDND